jgi:ATP/maltotriose-dependent transcriptional regulator MalT
MKIDSDLSPHPRYRLLEQIGKGGMGEVFRTHDRLTGQVVALKERFMQALALLRTLATLFPIGRPQALLWHGRSAALHGHKRLAEWLFSKSLRAAQHYQIPFDEALAHQALAEVAQARGDRAAAEKERSMARVLFERIGAHWHVADLSRLAMEHAS